MADMHQPRRKALCVRGGVNAEAPAFLRAISDEWVHALSLHCDVVTVETDFDFAEICDQVRPDFVIYDAIHWVRPHRVTVTNADAHPHIPRAFYFNCDPHDPARPLMLEMLAHYRIDTIFCGIEHLQQMPELSQYNCFVIPLFIDADIFRDYGVERNIPVSIFGGHYFPAFYPWRAKLAEELPHYVPTMLYPHPGYGKGGVNPFEVRDEKYARLLSASRFSTADTTRLDYVVRKHLEIPAAGAVLVAPDSDVVKAYGFVDLVNCILGEGIDLYTKITAVSADPALYESIRSNGHALIQGHYTRAHWTHIVDWFECRTRCGENEITQQAERFGRFRNVPATLDTPSVAQLGFGETPMSTALGSAAFGILTGDDLDTATSELTVIHGWADHVAEPRFLLGIIAMLRGQIDQALTLITARPKMRDTQVPGPDRYQFGPLDPCELSWLLLIAAITGDADFCQPLLERAKAVPHVNVRRALWILSGSPHDIDFGEEGLMGPLPGDCMSIHWLGQESFPQWLRLMARVLTVYGRTDAADFMQMIADAFEIEENEDDMGAELRLAC